MRHFLLTLCAFFIAHQAIAQVSEPGIIRVVRAEGPAFVTASDGARVALVAGAQLAAGSRIVTETNGRAVLLFSNGATIAVEPETTVAVEHFFHANPTSPNPDPNPSETLISLDAGEIFGNVERLDSRSRLNVRTPVGTAGIRGTTFRVTYNPRTRTCVISNLDGSVEWEGVQDSFVVNAGEEVLVVQREGPDGTLVFDVQVQTIARADVRRVVNALRAGIMARLGYGSDRSFPSIEVDGSILSPAAPVTH